MKRTSSQTLGLILFVSVALRVAVALYLGNTVNAPPLLTDQNSYHLLGERLITGHGFSFAEPWYPYYLPPNSPTSHWSFLYTMYVAAVYGVFGVHILAARIIQVILGGILLPLMVYRLARRVFMTSGAPAMTRLLAERGVSGEALALLSAGIAAVYFYFILYAATVMTETFYMVALVWSLEQAIALLESPSLKRGLLFGVSLGIATLMRQSILPWIVILLLWLVWVGRRRQRLSPTLKSILLAVVMLTLMIMPFTIRNYLVYGDFLLLNSNAGYAMYSAQHPMHGITFQAFEAAPLPADFQGHNEAQWDRELMKRGVRFVLDDPGRYLLLSLSRVVDYFEFWPNASSTPMNNLGRIGSFGLFLPFMIYGVWLVLRYASGQLTGGGRAFWFTPSALIIGFIVFYSMLHIFTWAMPRYRLPVDAVTLPFAALAISDLTRLIVERVKVRKQPGSARE